MLAECAPAYGTRCRCTRDLWSRRTAHTTRLSSILLKASFFWRLFAQSEIEPTTRGSPLEATNPSEFDGVSLMLGFTGARNHSFLFASLKTRYRLQRSMLLPFGDKLPADAVRPLHRLPDRHRENARSSGVGTRDFRLAAPAPDAQAITSSSRRHLGRPTASSDIRALICTMSEANPLWGHPNPRRTPETRDQDQSGDGREIHAPAMEAAVAVVAHVLDESQILFFSQKVLMMQPGQNRRCDHLITAQMR